MSEGPGEHQTLTGGPVKMKVIVCKGRNPSHQNGRTKRQRRREGGARGENCKTEDTRAGYKEGRSNHERRKEEKMYTRLEQ